MALYNHGAFGIKVPRLLFGDCPACRNRWW